MRSKIRPLLYYGAVICSVFTVIISIVAFTPLPNILSKPLIVPPRPQKADAILVLSGGVYSNGSLSYFTLERVLQAVILYNQGYSKKVIFSGGVSLNNQTIHDADAMKKTAIDLGVKDEDIILENKSKNTLENMQYSKSVIDEKGFHKILLVTSAIHSYRSMILAEQIGLDMISASPTPFEQYRQTPIDRLLLFYFTIREFGIILLYNTNIMKIIR